MCDQRVEMREVQFENSCQAMPQDASVTRRLAQSMRHARARANA